MMRLILSSQLQRQLEISELHNMGIDQSHYACAFVLIWIPSELLGEKRKKSQLKVNGTTLGLSYEHGQSKTNSHIWICESILNVVSMFYFTVICKECPKMLFP